MIIKLAWRNSWRNLRRSVLTLGSLVVALCCVLLMQAQQAGTYQHILYEAVSNHLGHLQIHHSRDVQLTALASHHFLPEKLFDDLQKSKIRDEGAFVPRLVYQAIVFGKAQSYQHVALWGIHLTQEDALSQVSQHIVSGTYFESSSEKNILIGEELAQKFEFRVGDKLRLHAQTIGGRLLETSYTIKGIFRLPTGTLNKRLVCLPLTTAQNFLQLPNKLSYLAILLKNPEKLSYQKTALEVQLNGKNCRVSTWQVTQPELAQLIRAQGVGSKLMMGVLYIVVGLGFFTNMILLLHERKLEQQLLLSVGMVQQHIALSLALELFFLGCIGLVIGNLLSLPLLHYLAHHPIVLQGVISETIITLGLSPSLYYRFDFDSFFLPNFYLLLMLVCLCIYPFYDVFSKKI